MSSLISYDNLKMKENNSCWTQVMRKYLFPLLQSHCYNKCKTRFGFLIYTNDKTLSSPKCIHLRRYIYHLESITKQVTIVNNKIYRTLFHPLIIIEITTYCYTCISVCVVARRETRYFEIREREMRHIINIIFSRV